MQATQTAVETKAMQIEADEHASQSSEALREISALELSLVGGGMGNVSFV